MIFSDLICVYFVNVFIDFRYRNSNRLTFCCFQDVPKYANRVLSHELIFLPHVKFEPYRIRNNRCKRFLVCSENIHQFSLHTHVNTMQSVSPDALFSQFFSVYLSYSSSVSFSLSVRSERKCFEKKCEGKNHENKYFEK